MSVNLQREIRREYRAMESESASRQLIPRTESAVSHEIASDILSATALNELADELFRQYDCEEDVRSASR